MKPLDQSIRLPRVLTTGVGSLPHTDPYRAVDLVLNSLGMAPHPPQLARSDPREQMWIQFTENLPRFRADLENHRYFFDTSGEPEREIEEFYIQYLEVVDGGAPNHFTIGADYGRGIHVLLERLGRESTKRPFVKVQVTGPLSFSLTVTDEKRKPIFYHPVFRDIAVKAMGLKAVWLLEAFRPYAEDVIVFFDEPSLSAYGSSAFLGVSKNDVLESLNEVMSMAVDRGGIPGVHCCGNTDWSMLMETGAVIINFDAVSYVDSLSIYGRELRDFLQRGGVLAWGAVRNTELVREEGLDTVVARLRDGLDLLERAGVERSVAAKQIIVTPACGCAGMAETDAEKVYAQLSELESKAPDALMGM